MTVIGIFLFISPAEAQPTSIDRLTPSFPSPAAQDAADITSWVTAVAPVIFDFQDAWQQDDRAEALLMQGARIGVTYGVGLAVKKLVDRDRPCAPYCGLGDSFYSLHTALPFSAIGGPELRFILPFAVSTGGLRIGAKKHWLTDVLAGAGAGYLASRIRPNDNR